MKSKQAMGIGQVFIFIVAAITFAVIMIFGYKAVSEFLQRGENVAFVQFKTDMEGDIKQIYTEYGAIRVEKYYPPGGIEQVCFVNMDHKPSSPEMLALCEKDQYACDVWESAWERADKKGHEAVDQNVFVTPLPENAPAIKTYRIAIAAQEFQFLCLDVVAGTFSLVLEGKGDHTELSKVE